MNSEPLRGFATGMLAVGDAYWLSDGEFGLDVTADLNVLPLVPCGHLACARVRLRLFKVSMNIRAETPSDIGIVDALRDGRILTISLVAEEAHPVPISSSCLKPPLNAEPTPEWLEFRSLRGIHIANRLILFRRLGPTRNVAGNCASPV